jgi:hypothetical protein
MRKSFCDLIPPDIQAWGRYEQGTHDAKSKCEAVLGKLLESDFGLHALHPGHFPNQWKMPGGPKKHNYPKADAENMMTSKDVVATQILKQPKLGEERDLINYAAHYTNISRTHKCVPPYCLKGKKFPVKYDPEQHGVLDDGKTWEKYGVLMTSVTVEDCHFDFGRKRKFDQSGKKMTLLEASLLS